MEQLRLKLVPIRDAGVAAGGFACSATCWPLDLSKDFLLLMPESQHCGTDDILHTVHLIHAKGTYVPCVMFFILFPALFAVTLWLLVHWQAWGLVAVRNESVIYGHIAGLSAGETCPCLIYKLSNLGPALWLGR